MDQGTAFVAGSLITGAVGIAGVIGTVVAALYGARQGIARERLAAELRETQARKDRLRDQLLTSIESTRSWYVEFLEAVGNGKEIKWLSLREIQGFDPSLVGAIAEFDWRGEPNEDLLALTVLGLIVTILDRQKRKVLADDSPMEPEEINRIWGDDIGRLKGSH